MGVKCLEMPFRPTRPESSSFDLSQFWAQYIFLLTKPNQKHKQATMAFTLMKVIIKVIYIVSRWALIECPLLHGNIQKEADTEKSICYDFMRFGDSSTVTNLLKQ